MMKNQYVICCLACVCVFALPVFGFQGTVKASIYSAPQSSIKISLPAISSLKIKDGSTGKESWASFISNTPYWVMEGGYFLKWRKIDNSLSVLTMNNLTLSRFLSTLDIKHPITETQSCQRLRIHNTQAVQCTVNAMLHNTYLLAVGTQFVIKDRIFTAFAVKAIQDGPRKLDFNWQRYDTWLHSIQVD